MSNGRPLYDRIGATYDVTRRADPDLAQRLVELLKVPRQSKILDIGCGTGNYTVALAELDCAMTGLDRSALMLRQARRKSPTLPLVCADAGAMPFLEGAFAGAICTLVIHHFADLEQPLAEARRVLHGGRLVLFTALPEQMMHYWLVEYFPDMLSASAEQMPEWPAIDMALRRAGFRTWRQIPYWLPQQPMDHFLYCGKHQPELYLDPGIRANISSFAALAKMDEIATGLEKLREDIANGEFEKVRTRYRDEAGDYLFVVVQA